MVGILELGDLLLRNVNLSQDFVLSVSGSLIVLVFLLELFDFGISGLVAASLACLNLALQTVGRGLNWHTCAVESEGEHCVLADLLLVSHLELSL